jgi:hypothetical protein
MTDNHSEYLASGSGEKPADHERLDMIRAILADEATWLEPPPEVGDAVIASIAASSEPRYLSDAGMSRRSKLLAGMAAAAVVLIVAVGLSFALDGEPGEIVMAVEGTELEAGASGEATLVPTGDGWSIQLEVSDLPAAESGTYYEGWMWNDEGEGVSIGTFHLRGGGEMVILWSGVSPDDYPSIWVTHEDEDGDPSASDRVVLRGRLPDQQS